MQRCLNCEGALEIARLHCPACGVTYGGRFQLSRLARLDAGQQALVEQLILCAANLKQVAVAEGVSYPTLRKRFEALIEAMHEMRAEDEARSQTLLDEVEAGSLRPEMAARLIREAGGGL